MDPEELRKRIAALKASTAPLVDQKAGGENTTIPATPVQAPAVAPIETPTITPAPAVTPPIATLPMNPTIPVSSPETIIPPTVPPTAPPKIEPAPAVQNTPSTPSTPLGEAIKQNETATPTPEEKHLAGVRTLSTDMAQAVRQQEQTVIKSAFAEEKRREQEEEAIKESSKKNIYYIIGTVIVIGLIMVVGWYIFIYQGTKTDTVPISATLHTLIASDKNKGFRIQGLTKDQFNRTIRNEVLQKPVTKDIVTNYYFVDGGKNLPEEVLDGPGFLQKIESHAPTGVMISLSSPYMLGILSGDTTNTPFLILKTDNFESGVTGMLEWENNMLDDFYLMWDINVAGTRAQLLGRQFQDTVLKNRDARVLVDDAGKIVLVYVFINETTILITTDDTIVPEILARYEQVL